MSVKNKALVRWFVCILLPAFLITLHEFFCLFPLALSALEPVTSDMRGSPWLHTIWGSILVIADTFLLMFGCIKHGVLPITDLTDIKTVFVSGKQYEIYYGKNGSFQGIGEAGSLGVGYIVLSIVIGSLLSPLVVLFAPLKFIIIRFKHIGYAKTLADKYDETPIATIVLYSIALFVQFVLFLIVMVNWGKEGFFNW